MFILTFYTEYLYLYNWCHATCSLFVVQFYYKQNAWELFINRFIKEYLNLILICHLKLMIKRHGTEPRKFRGKFIKVYYNEGCIMSPLSRNAPHHFPVT